MKINVDDRHEVAASRHSRITLLTDTEDNSETITSLTIAVSSNNVQLIN